LHRRFFNEGDAPIAGTIAPDLILKQESAFLPAPARKAKKLRK
jgi:hypothetical protein